MEGTSKGIAYISLSQLREVSFDYQPQRKLTFPSAHQ